MSDPRRDLPSVSALLESAELRPLLGRAPRPVVVGAVRRAIESARREPARAPRDADGWAASVAEAIDAATRPSLRRVVNATGVVLHTNLGRAPLAAAAMRAIGDVAAGYSTLEYDVERGERGSRYVHCASLLRELTGAQDALVVNNGAAAMVLALNSLANARECLVSRGELVEIGGSFRVPEIMARSGARLVEVGTTNRTHLDDYRRAIGERTGAIAKVHRSNFVMEGFVAEVPGGALARLAAEHGLPLLHDLGSGLLIPLDGIGLTGEPTATEALDAGATLVTMSGDKLLGGPQAGIILGNEDAIASIRANPLLRAFRVDKLTLAALEATLAIYRDPAVALREIPVLAMLAAPLDSLRERGERILMALGAPEVIRLTESAASVGGGAFPATRLPSLALAIEGNARELERALRAALVIARIEDDRVLLDLRTVLADEDGRLTDVLRTLLG